MIQAKYLHVCHLLTLQTSLAKTRKLYFLACWYRWRMARNRLNQGDKGAAFLELNQSAKALRQAWHNI